MRKIFFFACLLACTIAWAAKPEQIVRAYMGQHGGYVLVDANNEVIGMSDNNTALEVSDGVRNFLEAHGKKIEIVRANLPAEITMPQAAVEYGPVLGAIEFDQGAPYNNLTPKVGEKQCVTGCVATAMAMIMAYWKYPQTCKDTVLTYQTADLGLIVTYDYGKQGIFDWDNVLDTYKGVAATEAQKTAVANLMLACGVSVDMNYTTGESGSYSPKVPDALVIIFKYKKGLKFRTREQDLTAQEFSDVLRDEFKAGRPVYCSGNRIKPGEPHAGHAFVIDGFRSQDDSNQRYSYYHFNFGWSGSGNAWLKIPDCEYNNGMTVITGIEPDQATGLFDATATDFVKDGRIYDMMGHVVTETISGNLYIRNGEKFMAQ